jgi:hypothetical protein
MNTDQLAQARAILTAGRIEDMYAYIAAFGHRYASLASGVARGNMFSGLSALEFLEETARAAGTPLDAAGIQEVRRRMADALLSTLGRIADLSNGQVTREITADEAWGFHNEVFDGLDLPVDAGTMNTPFELMDANERAEIWDSLLESNGRLPWDSIAGLQLTEAVWENSDGGGKAWSWFKRLGFNEDIYSAWLARASTESLQGNPLALVNPTGSLVTFFAATALYALWVFDRQGRERVARRGAGREPGLGISRADSLGRQHAGYRRRGGEHERRHDAECGDQDGQRRVIDYLLSPLRQHVGEGMRER